MLFAFYAYFDGVIRLGRWCIQSGAFSPQGGGAFRLDTWCIQTRLVVHSVWCIQAMVHLVKQTK